MSLVARIVVPSDHPSLAGHFPDRPIVPGVVLLDHIVAAVRVHLPAAVRLTTIASAKFLRPVLPGEVVDIGITVAIESHPETQWRVQVAGSIEQQAALEAALVFREREGTLQGSLA